MSERRLTSHERRAGKPWDASYTEGTPPWDIGGPQPEVVRLEFDGPLLDAGCGSGDNAIEIARRGIEVVGVDVASTAIRQAQAKAAGLPVTFVVADALQLHRLGRTFPSVLDCGLFHTFDVDIGEAFLPAAFAAGWNVASIDAGRLLSAFGALPAWVARIERAPARQN